MTTKTTKQNSKWVDYKALKTKVNVLDVLRHFGIELKTTNGSQHYGICPLPCHAGDRDNPNAFSLNSQKNAWRCLTHCGSGNVIDLYARLLDQDPSDKTVFRECAVEMQERFLGGVETLPSNRPARTKSPVESKPLEPNNPLKFTLNVKADIPYLLEEKKFPADFLTELGIGWVSKGMFSGRVVVPIHNEKGELVAYAGRGLKEADIIKRGRWLLPKSFHKSMELFNQHRAMECDLESDGLVVVEGFWSTLRWHQAGYPAVGLMGCDLSDYQLDCIASMTSKVWLMLDNDEAGQKALEKVVLKLAGKVAVRIVNYPDDSPHTQPEDFTTDELIQLLPE